MKFFKGDSNETVTQLGETPSLEVMNCHSVSFASDSMTFATASHIGHVRSANEDRIAVNTQCGVCAVADGMGGYAGGEQASQLIREKLQALTPQESLIKQKQLVDRAIGQAHEGIVRYREQTKQSYSGSTVVGVILREGRGLCFWAGDSRLYRYRKAQALEQLTTDHNSSYDLIKQGILSQGQCVGNKNVITNAVGLFPEGAALEWLEFELKLGDQLLLSSDGFHEVVSAAQVESVLQRSDSVAVKAETLQTMALCSEAKDNLSLILVEYQ